MPVLAKTMQENPFKTVRPSEQNIAATPVVPVMDKAKPKSAAESIAPMEPRRPKPSHPGQIEVVATRDGFYGRDRWPEGSRFRIDSFEELGTWMMPVDPVIAAKWKAEMAAKKRDRNMLAKRQTDYDSGH